MFGFTLQDISKWGENFIQDHLNYTFDELGTSILQALPNYEEWQKNLYAIEESLVTS